MPQGFLTIAKAVSDGLKKNQTCQVSAGAQTKTYVFGNDFFGHFKGLRIMPISQMRKREVVNCKEIKKFSLGYFQILNANSLKHFFMTFIFTHPLH